MRARTCEPRNFSSAATSSAPRRSPTSGRDWYACRRSSATGTTISTIPTSSKPCPSHHVSSTYDCVSAGMRAVASQTMPTATERSSQRRVKRYVRTARQRSSAKNTKPATSAVIAAGLFGAGTGGTRLGVRSAETPSPITTASRIPWSSRSRGTASGRRSEGSAVSARIAPPTGSVAPPVKATTPLFPTITPGEAKPWRASSAAITANAVPMSTVRPSRRLAPTMVRVTAAIVVANAVVPTQMK